MIKEEILKILEEKEARSMHGQLPVVWSCADGYYVWDEEGKKYIDFTSTIFVTNSGHGNREIGEAVIEQIRKPLIHSYTFPTEIRAKFLQKLSEFTGYDKSFLVSSGTEATEVACKLMRMYGLRQNDERKIIVSFAGSMHGRTMLAEQLKGPNKTNKWAIDEVEPVLNIDFPKYNTDIGEVINDLDLYKDCICGIIFEGYQGWSASFYPKEYIKEIYKWAKENDVLICFDEIQSGMGRTGKKFAYEYYDIKPDLICLGKALSNGFPLSAVCSRKEILDIPDIGSMSSTHSANPIVCAAGLANLNYFEQHNLIEEAHRKGKIAKDIIEKKVSDYLRYGKYIKKVNGIGLVYGFIFDCEATATKICYKAMEKGLLLVHTGRESIKIGPPLVIADEVLIEGLNIFFDSIEEVVNK